jgi:hypothetical protein
MNKEKQIKEMAKVIASVPPIEFPIGSRMQGRHIYTTTKIAEALYNADFRKQSEGKLTKAHIEAHYEAICALADMVYQFGYSTTFRRQDSVCDGGLSSLEYAFGALLDCGCKVNSNGTITLKNLLAFQEEIRSKMKGGEQ